MKFVCWLFRGNGFNRSKVMSYTPEHVRVLQAMLERHGGHELICITDQGREVSNAGVKVMDMPEEVSGLPIYYPKLWAFSETFGAAMGERFASIDLDVVLTGDPASVFPDTDFAIWDQAKGELYNSSLFALEPGARKEVWDRFTPEAAERAKTNAMRWTGDQSWIGEVLGDGEETFSQDDGIIQYRPSLHRERPAGNGIAYFFCGPMRPDTESVASPWIRNHYHA